MQVAVDFNRCQGSAQCAFLAPSVSEPRDDEALVYAPPVPDGRREPLLRAATACPVPVKGDPKGGRIVVASASPAGLRTAGTPREEDFDGRPAIVGDVLHCPYDRPPLSRQVLLGKACAEDCVLPARRRTGPRTHQPGSARLPLPVPRPGGRPRWKL
ncbi:ferredoxin [Streptomyces sp. 769]|uniref:ferredoxin n=1 Tax=Streptomyces sp. 769 TaxID=1262452 RepID=UPI0005821DAC|nr:FAD-dependent pyridine nucleotide-disulfide oxidoreductase [Streptomyces sp. 769]